MVDLVVEFVVDYSYIVVVVIMIGKNFMFCVVVLLDVV